MALTGRSVSRAALLSHAHHTLYRATWKVLLQWEMEIPTTFPQWDHGNQRIPLHRTPSDPASVRLFKASVLLVWTFHGGFYLCLSLSPLHPQMPGKVLCLLSYWIAVCTLTRQLKDDSGNQSFLCSFGQLTHRDIILE